jgi:DNA-binding response OmpR family regulator
VLVARDGQTAVELAAREEPDLIVLDIKMPGMDGCDVCQRIREFSTVPIIMLITPTGSADKVIRGLYAGADHCMTKPFSVAELLARMRAVLRRAGLSRRKGLQPTFQPVISGVFLPNGDLRSVFAQRRVPVVD